MLRAINYPCYACTLISVPLALYLYFQQIQERAPTYYVSPERTRIVDASIPAPSQLQVLYKGRDLKANVSTVTVYLWNDGKLPIKADDVLEPLKIELELGSEILDARLVKVSRAVTMFAKGDVSDESKNVLPVSFKILEHTDGAVLQLTYSGKPDATVHASGIVAGAGELRRLSEDPSRFAPTTRKQIAAQALKTGLLTGLIGSWLLGVCSGFFMWDRKLPASRPGRAFFFVLLLVGAAVLGWGEYLQHASRQTPTRRAFDDLDRVVGCQT